MRSSCGPIARLEAVEVGSITSSTTAAKPPARARGEAGPVADLDDAVVLSDVEPLDGPGVERPVLAGHEPSRRMAERAARPTERPEEVLQNVRRLTRFGFGRASGVCSFVEPLRRAAGPLAAA
jgi:hypothetical protein